MNALYEYLEKQDERLSAFAVRIGRAPSTLSRALSGARNPSVELARDVERGTAGRVTATQFISICLDGPSPAVAAGPLGPHARAGHPQSGADA